MKNWFLIALVVVMSLGFISPNTATGQTGGQGAVQFDTGSGFGGDAAKFFWNDTAKKLGIGTNSPNGFLHILGNQNSRFQVNIQNTNTGTDATAAITVGSAFDSTGQNHYGIFWHASPNFTPIGPMKPNTTIVEGVDVGGLLLDAFVGDLVFATQNIERARFVGPRLGIGTDNPLLNSHLHVNVNENSAGRVSLTNPNTGASAFAEWSLGQEITGVKYGRVAFFPTTFSPIGLLGGGRLVVEGIGPGGTEIIASNLEGIVGIAVGGSGLNHRRLEVNQQGTHALGYVQAPQFKVSGVKVVGSQCAAISDASPVSDPPTAAEINAVVAKLNSWLSCARSHGLIAQ